MTEIKTTPDMTINVKQMLKMSDDPTNQYAAQLIEELEAQAAVMREAAREFRNSTIDILDILKTYIDLYPTQLPTKGVDVHLMQVAEKRIGKYKNIDFSSTAGQDLLDRLKALEEENKRIKKDNDALDAALLRYEQGEFAKVILDGRYERKCKAYKERIAELFNALALARSMILSGENFTYKSQQIIDGALERNRGGDPPCTPTQD